MKKFAPGFIILSLLFVGAGCMAAAADAPPQTSGPAPQANPEAAAHAATPTPPGNQGNPGTDDSAALDGLEVHPPLHVRGNATTGPTGLSPTKIRTAYNLPATGGSGTIALIDAFDDPNAAADLATFSSAYGLPTCTVANGCFEKHLMATSVKADSGWGLEESLDIEWAHAIAPSAKILLVEAKSASGTDLLSAVDYARARAGVVAVSMSWGGNEFATEAGSDFHFTSITGATFFASSGDSGTGAEWPAVSSNITAVGGTTLTLASTGTVTSEKAWSGSGGGLSRYESEPAYQIAYAVPKAGGKRAEPDVSYDADPATGFSVYDSFQYNGQKGWFTVGGTSAGAPQWAAIKALGGSASNAKFYPDAVGASYGTHFRDVLTGTNGSCGFFCAAAVGFDYVTGLGSPLTVTY